jgi:hypothetical protein
MKLIGLCFAVLTASWSQSVMADSWQNASSFWDHNGSIVGLEAEGNHRRFIYAFPRTGMQNAGATEGALLFDGETSGTSYAGIAYIFNARCGQTPYTVSGPILDNGRRVVMHGRAPRIGRNCQVSGYFEDTLVFTLTTDPRSDQ